MARPFSLTYYDPPESLKRHITVLFHFATEADLTEDSVSGALAQFNIFPRGTGEICFDAGTQPVTAKANLHAGMTKAASFRMRGPWHAIGASLTPLGWAALTGQAASDHIDRYFPAAELLGEEAFAFGEEVSAQYILGQLEPEAACDAVGDWLAARLGSVSPQHEKLIEQTISWLGSALNPDIEDLFPTLNYSRRQAERLVERFFGLPPAAVARKFRAIRSAAILAKEGLSDAEAAAVAEAFYDQPHMVREIRRYCGHTPTRLGGAGQPILKTLLQMKNFDRLQKFRAL
ncbi:helix-turn-helix domain-containing protein [Aurantiacibacter sediminis]|uniref:Helix-turn-helix domain-containing protein n=1 Tax=Aurantiacibacter sediminis TaxID=2793064 RepID=A0ABS0N0F6_9SPHN|nr:helix-turn-helix domain-containing protein [Aurantiacibacter sediminis]MBH5321450.1 helix-turn-helix domain-containing protein [Aurantiacibacter sediminis]